MAASVRRLTAEPSADGPEALRAMLVDLDVNGKVLTVCQAYLRLCLKMLAIGAEPPPQTSVAPRPFVEASD